MDFFLKLESDRFNGGAVRGRYALLGVLFFVLLSPLALLEGATTAKSQDVISGIDKAQRHREQKLAGYTATEYYTVKNSHFDQIAKLKATVRYQKERGKTYQVVSRSGPEFLQKRVLDRILKEDATLSRNSEKPHTLLISTNYSMKIKGTQLMRGKLCYVLGIHPLVHSSSLIEGTAWVEVQGFALLRVEGRPAASPSFWIGRPFIEREYTLIDGLSFPQHSRVKSQGFFAGKSELDVDYSQYSISISP